MQTALFDNIAIEDSTENEITYKAESYKGLYAMHKYWGKKPFNIMADFISRHSEVDDVVLDPFCGSGVTISEAVFNNRKAIGVDINPSSILITKNVIQPVDINRALEEFDKLSTAVRDRIQSLYTVERNGQRYEGKNFLWTDGKLTEVRYSDGGRSTCQDIPNEMDVNLANSITYDQITSYIPVEHFLHNSRINAKRDNRVSDLFTPRNLQALSWILEEINNIHDERIRDLFRFCFTSSVGQASKMVFVIKNRGGSTGNDKKEVGSWVIGYWMPTEFFENNAWTCFENRFRKIVKAKKAQESTGNDYVRGMTMNCLSDANYLLVNKPAQQWLKTLGDNSIDYILTDPPHGNRIPYLELSLLWNSWLQDLPNLEDEVVVSECKDRSKGKAEYNQLLYSVFQECFRVLKPNRKLSFMFNSLDDDAWISAISMFRNIGYCLEAIETLGYSANSVVQDNRKNGLQTDFILTYRKPDDPVAFPEIDLVELSADMDVLRKIYAMKYKGYKPYQIMNNVIKELLSEDKFVRMSELIKVIENA